VRERVLAIDAVGARGDFGLGETTYRVAQGFQVFGDLERFHRQVPFSCGARRASRREFNISRVPATRGIVTHSPRRRTHCRRHPRDRPARAIASGARKAPGGSDRRARRNRR
jgi:hypothetical protein